VRTLDAADTLDRIAVTRSLHDLWHLRAEVFSHVSRRHGQLEATRRLADIDCHFRTRPRRFGIAPAADRGAGDARRG